MAVSTQLEGFPLNVTIFHPYGQKRSAQVVGWAECEDGHKYLIKGNSGSPLVSANEWVCSSVADFLHLPTPPCKVLKMRDGTLVFGSRFVTNELPALIVSRLLKSGLSPNDLLVPELVPNLSRLYAFDLLVGNPDRHLFNYLFTEERSVGSAQRLARLHAIDFDAADLLVREQLHVPMPPSSNTVSTGRQIRVAHRFDPSAANEMLARFLAAPEVILTRAMDGLPEEWLPRPQRERFLNRVSAARFGKQIAELQQGLSNGTYL